MMIEVCRCVLFHRTKYLYGIMMMFSDLARSCQITENYGRVALFKNMKGSFQWAKIYLHPSS